MGVQQYHDETQMATAQPYLPSDERASPPMPTMQPTDPPPGVDQDQLPQAHLGGG